MKTLHSSRRLIIGSDRALLTISVVLLLSAALLPASFYWPELRSVRDFGLFGLLLSPAILMLSCWELFRHGRRWRTFLAAFILLVASVASWGTTILYATGYLH
jgi:hypothetical protein